MTGRLDKFTINAGLIDPVAKMLTRLLIIVLIALPSWYFSDMDSPSRFFAYILPLLTFASFIAFCFWVIAVFAHMGEHEKRQDR